MLNVFEKKAKSLAECSGISFKERGKAKTVFFYPHRGTPLLKGTLGAAPSFCLHLCISLTTTYWNNIFSFLLKIVRGQAVIYSTLPVPRTDPGAQWLAFVDPLQERKDS